MKADPRRKLLNLPQIGEISEGAIRTAYWRLIAQTQAPDSLAALRAAKTSLLHDAGVRVPPARKPRG